MRLFLEEYKWHVLVVFLVIVVWISSVIIINQVQDRRFKEADPVGYRACELFEESIAAPKIYQNEIRRESAETALKAKTPAIRNLPDDPSTDRFGHAMYRTAGTFGVYDTCGEVGYHFSRAWY